VSAEIIYLEAGLTSMHYEINKVVDAFLSDDYIYHEHNSTINSNEYSADVTIKITNVIKIMGENE
jgi:hypothetical protein